MTTTAFFVYGSMSEGLVHFNKIQEFIVSSVPARIRATAYRLKVGYPVLLKEPKDFVPGYLVQVRASDILIGMLDEFFCFNRQVPEQSIYSRESIEVFSDSSDEIVAEAAQVYFLNPKKMPLGALLIEGGDWLYSLAEKPALTEQLNERQIIYIQRLGKSTGREIVPIDLGLYRELMNLELIVDKGRRLALSKLGHEVYRHLG